MALFSRLWAAAGFLLMVGSFRQSVAEVSLGSVWLLLLSAPVTNHMLPPGASSLEFLGDDASLPGMSCNGFSKGSLLLLPV